MGQRTTYVTIPKMAGVDGVDDLISIREVHAALDAKAIPPRAFLQ
jgi:hypothetical protein